MGPGIDKLFLEAAGVPVVAHTWKAFDRSPEVDHVILVVRSGMEEAFHDLARQHVHPGKPWSLAAGGAERQDSVWNGLAALPSDVGWVAIQDGARPCTHAQVIADCLGAARKSGAAVAAQRMTDTIKESEDGSTVARHLDRSRLWSVQTPQCFAVPVIRRALEEVRRRGESVTDDTAACERIGQSVVLVEGRWPNPKVTVPSDLPYVELLLRAETP